MKKIILKATVYREITVPSVDFGMDSELQQCIAAFEEDLELDGYKDVMVDWYEESGGAEEDDE